jgi:nitrate reductase gamma subunit
MGLGRKLETTLEPWLCYYCGQCSEQCPRQADPGETMMSIRRWLISRYDFTRIARQFFRSRKTEILAIILIALLTGIAVLYYNSIRGSIYVYDGEDAFLPSSLVHRFDLILGSFLGLMLAIGAIRMWYLTMSGKRGVHIPWWLYVKNFHLLPLHFFTQKRYAACESKKNNKLFMPWFVHLGLMLGYVTMLLIVMAFLPALQSGPEILWTVHVFGYLATAGLLIGTVFFIYSRYKKNQVQYKKSHGTDWVFVILLFLIALTGIIQHLFHRAGLIVPANVTYLIHLMLVVPWLFRMPFSKWAHLVYRPLAMYFADVRKEALALQEKKTESIPEAQYAF